MPHAGAHALFLDLLLARAASAGVFGPVAVKDGVLVCHAKAAAAPASYRVLFDRGGVWAALVTADRWLSESIEADLMHTGDKLEDLIEEELVELGQGGSGEPVRCEHFRSDDLLFTFRTPIPISERDLGSPRAVELAAAYLLAYEACFRRLGDMESAAEG